MNNINCTHCKKHFGAVDSFVEVETAAIVGSTQCCWPHLHRPGKERPPLVSMVMMIMEMTDMEFVQNFTPPDFQAKNFTPSISPHFNSFSKKNHKK